MAQSEGKIKGSYVVSTISISLVLLVVGALVFILLNGRRISDHVKRNVGFVVILKDRTNEAEVKHLQKTLDIRPFTHASRYVSKEEAARLFKEEMGEDFEAILGINPLLPSIELTVTPAYANNDSLEMMATLVSGYDIVQDVFYQPSLVQRINDNLKRISLVFLVVGGVLMLISFTLIRNTIHLAVYARRMLIKTMQLVGATPFFISRPFLGSSMWQGFFGGMIANVLLAGGLMVLQDTYGDSLEVFFAHPETLGVMVLFVVVCGMILSLLSAWFSVSRYLRKDLNELYV